MATDVMTKSAQVPVVPLAVARSRMSVTELQPHPLAVLTHYSNGVVTLMPSSTRHSQDPSVDGGAVGVPGVGREAATLAAGAKHRPISIEGSAGLAPLH